MSYLVMECHKSYAVVLSEDAKFLKVANLNYKVGQKVEKVIELGIVEQTGNKSNIRKIVFASASAAASFAIIALGTWQLCFVSVATLHLQINPKIDMDINRLGYVLDIRAMNDDANKLLEGSQFSTAKAEDMATNISLMAKKEHYLDEDKNIYIEVSSDDKSLSSSLELKLQKTLEENMDDDVVVHIGAEPAADTEITETVLSTEESSTQVPESSVDESEVIQVAPSDDGSPATQTPTASRATQTAPASTQATASPSTSQSLSPARSTASNDDDDDNNDDNDDDDDNQSPTQATAQAAGDDDGNDDNAQDDDNN